MFLSDTQNEMAYLESRWRLNDAPGAQFVRDDAGGINLVAVNTPLLQQLSLERHYLTSSGMGSYVAGTSSYWSAPVTSFPSFTGIALQSVTAMEPYGNSFYLLNVPNQCFLQVTSGTGITFGVYTTSLHTLAAPGVLTGRPQLVTASYDAQNGLMSLYVDGLLVNSSTLTGAVATVSSTTATLLQPVTLAGTYFCPGQDIAIYAAPISFARVTRMQNAFLQSWPDVGHVKSYGQVGANA